MDRLRACRPRPTTAGDDAQRRAASRTPAPSRVEGLTLACPNGQALLKDARFELPQGRATLISGASGSGKSTLFRALAGIWPFGKGHVHVPAGARVLFLPQKPYIPIGTLRDAVEYPDEQSTASDAEIARRSRPCSSAISRRVWPRRRTGPTSCRAASSSGWPWRARWSSSPTGCSSTRRTAALDEPMEAAIYGP